MFSRTTKRSLQPMGLPKREIDRDITLIYLTETWRRAIDNKLVVGAVFIDFQKAFDCVSHPNLLHKLEHNFGITGNLLAWLRDYLSEWEQYSVINGVSSENIKVAHGIPQDSVLGPILFALYKSDQPKAVSLQRCSCMPTILLCTALENRRTRSQQC